MNHFITYAQKKGIKVVLIKTPITKEKKRGVLFYDNVYQTIEKVAIENNIEFIDFNQRMELDSEKCFRDDNHLNTKGAQIFMDELVGVLAERGYLEGIQYDTILE